MVSPAQSVAANPPPLSYAERARKAQNARHSPQVTQQRSTSQGASSSAAIPAAFAAPNFAASRSAAQTSPSTASKATPSSHSVNDARLSTSSHPPPASSSKPTTAPAVERLAEPRSNGDVNHNSDSPSSAPIAAVQKQASVPTVNVWDMRKEQMVARGVTQPLSASSTFPLPGQTSTGALVPSHQSGSNPSALPPTSSTSPNSPQPSLPPTASNGHLAPPSAHDDPFVVRPGRSPPKLSPPAIDDAESWPEVGQVVATPPHVSDGRPEGKGKEGDADRGHEREASQGHGARKSEKTKWLPVPPEELQFERPNRTQHQRPRLPHTDRTSRPPGGHSGAPSTSSGQGSQQQSRAQSSAGMRPPPLHASSVSHSQAQSRTGSVHSSPRHSSVRGGGRRLPDEGGAPAFGASRSMRSSGPNSPAAFAQPRPLPPQEFIPGVRSFIGASGGQGGWDSSSLNTVPDSGVLDMPPPSAYYPPSGPPLSISPYHSPQPAGSPAHNPYALPPIAYPGQPGVPAPVPAPGYGTPPYAMYAPYPYPYGQPYMYWPPHNGPPPLPHSIPPGSPMINPVQPSDLGIPPPTLMARPPPPDESEAVAGYREVGLPLPPAEESQSQQNGGHIVISEQGRQTRELSFGSIALESAQSPSPAPGSPNTGAGRIPGGAVMGLDAENGKPSISAEEHGDEDKPDGKTFAVFSIGVAPGESGPARLRSRAQSKGAATSVSGTVELPLKGSEGEPSGTSIVEAVAVLADVAAKVIDLTDFATKWEFGTTNYVEEPDAGRTDNVAPPVMSDTHPVDVSSHHPSITAAPFVPMIAHYAAPPYVPPVVIPGAPVNGMSSATSPSAFTPRHPPTSATESDEWEVRDYGFGFGRGGPPGAGPQSAYPSRDDRSFRDRRDFQLQGDNFGRPRRGSYGQGGFDRGSFGGRRGRGLSGGYGGRGYSNRSFSGGRGGYANQAQQRQPAYAPPAPPPPPLPQQDVNGYYAPPIPPLATYIPSPYEAYPYVSFPAPPPPPQMAGLQTSAPLPVPQSQLLFPLDSTRYYLLGQLEYYLSAQNMTQDFFLRQQMDSRGWIPIPLIASFNRVRTLTTDPQIVTDVLTLSSLVEVRDGHVRMNVWTEFVLPTAHPSLVEPDNGAQVGHASLAPIAPEGAEFEAHIEHPAEHEAHDGEEDEEEDVEFVL